MDNEANIEEQEVDIIDMLATQSEGVGDEDGEIDLDTDDIEVLKERIAKRNKALKKSKQANHRIQGELEDMRAMIESMKQNPAAPNEEAQKQEQKEAFAKWQESVKDNPELALDYFNMQMTETQNKTVDYIASLQSTLESKIAELDKKLDPERNKYADKVNALRTNPDFADMDDDALLKVAKVLSERIPRGTLGGRKAEAVVSETDRIDALREKAKQALGVM